MGDRELLASLRKDTALNYLCQHRFPMPMAGNICAKYAIIIYTYNYTQFESYQYLYSAENSRDIKNIFHIYSGPHLINWEEENI